MSISQPSKQTYIIEVPDCKNFEAKFKYNYFDPQESINENAGVPLKYRTKSSEVRDASFRKIIGSRVPRWVALNWVVPKLNLRGLFSFDSNQKEQLDVSNNQGIIKNNLDKILSEDAFASDGFATLKFQDNKLSDKAFFTISGSYVQHTITDPQDNMDSHTRAALRAETLAPPDVNPEFINVAMTQPILANDIQQHENKTQKVNIDVLTDKLNKTSISAQVNTRLLSSMIEQSSDQMSNEPNDFDVIKEAADMLETNQQNAGQDDVNDDDFKFYLPYFKGKVDNIGRTPKRYVKLIGFIIDKREILIDGTTIEKDPIIIENPKISETLDFAVKYNTQYAYQIRAIYKISIPAIDEISGDIAILDVLISSSPTDQVFVPTIELESPPPPTDINFVWDYKRLNREQKPGSLMVHWTFPPNPQRDIKKFQIYRRKSIEHPFELVKMYNFDDSVKPISIDEEYDNSVIENLTSPATWWFDDEFTKTSKFIYTICSVDAHGYVSDYGAQFEIRFDKFENKIKKRLISHTGAPRPYPNLYLENDLFIDSIKVKGSRSKKLSIYFNPEYYRLLDDDNKDIQILSTKQLGGSYKLQFINLDNQKQRQITILIDDSFKKATGKENFLSDENSLVLDQGININSGLGRTRLTR